MFYQTSSDEGIMNKTEEYSSEKFENCGKIKFRSHNDLTLSMQEHSKFYFHLLVT